MSANPSIHDNFVRSILGNKKMAIAYLKNYLPPSISKQLNFSTLTQLADTYLSDNLKKSMSDIVYSCQLKNGRGSRKVCLLIEHKSYPDEYTSVQVGGVYLFGFAKSRYRTKSRCRLLFLCCFTMAKGNGNTGPWRDFLIT